MEFSNVFLIQESFTVYTPNLFCSFDHHLPIAAVPEYLSYLLMFFDFKSDLKRWGNVQTTVTNTYFPKKVSVRDKSDILLIQF